MDDTSDDTFEMISEWPITQAEAHVKQEDLKCTNKRKHECGTEPDVQKKTAKSVHKEPLANIALAKWWRRNHSKLHTAETDAVKGCHPNTLIKIIASLPEGKDFISSEIHRLQSRLDQGTATRDVHAAVASFLEKQGEIQKAVYHGKLALSLQPEESEYKWLLHKLQRIASIKAVQKDGLRLVESDSMFPALKQVERRSAADLSLMEFYQNYECTSTPVIITGQKVTTVEWTMQHIKQIAGECNVTLRRPVKESVEWARLETGQTMTVSSYINEVTSSTLTQPLYLFDWSIPINCPALAEQLIIPKYFAGDFLKKMKDSSLYRHSWPSLFIAPAGITSELHVDAFGSNFWMALFEGKKRWVFFPASDVPYLYPEYHHSLDPVFDVELSAPDLLRHPLLQLTHPVECILEPGDVLFVPAGCPHRVENLEASLAISANFVDNSNLSLVKKELEVNSLIDVRSRELLDQLNALETENSVDFSVQDEQLL